MTEVGNRGNGSGAYGAGVAVTILASILMVWATIVHDDGNGAGVFMVIMAAGVAALAARFQAAGIARGLVGVAAMQIVLGLLIATAPVVARVPGESGRALIFAGIFAGLWLSAAALFQAAARRYLSVSVNQS